MAKASENVFPKVQFSEEAAPATPSAGEAVVYVKTDGKIYLKDDAGTETDLTASGGGGGTANLLHVHDAKTANTAGGTFTSGSFQTRTLNTVVTNEISGASLASNQITLPAGTYYVEWEAPASRVNKHQSKLRDVTNSTDLLIGSSGMSSSGGTDGNTHSFGRGRITLAGSADLEVQHQCETTGTTTGFGFQGNAGVTEIYTSIRITEVT